MKNHLTKVLGIFAFAALALGSASTKEQQQAYVNQVNAQCAGYGFKRGSAEYSNCLMQLDTQNRATASREARCQGAMSQAYLAPTRTGSFAESQQIASAAYNRCMSGN